MRVRMERREDDGARREEAKVDEIDDSHELIVETSIVEGSDIELIVLQVICKMRSVLKRGICQKTHLGIFLLDAQI